MNAARTWLEQNYGGHGYDRINEAHTRARIEFRRPIEGWPARVDHVEILPVPVEEVLRRRAEEMHDFSARMGSAGEPAAASETRSTRGASTDDEIADLRSRRLRDVLEAERTPPPPGAIMAGWSEYLGGITAEDVRERRRREAISAARGFARAEGRAPSGKRTSKKRN